MNVLILGGTGAMGGWLRKQLSSMGFNVYVTSRSTHSADSSRITYVTGDAKDEGFLQSLCESKWDSIIDFMVWTTEEFKRRVQLFLRTTSQYIFLSSYRVFAESQVITEDSPRLLDTCKDEKYLATDEYALAKARCENLLFGSGVDGWTIVRPAITYDRSGRLQLGPMESDVWLWRALKGIATPFPAEILKKQTTMTCANDVANMIAHLVGNQRALGETFITATSEHLSWHDVIATYNDVLPVPLLMCAAQQFMKTTGIVWQLQYDRMLDRILDNAKVLRITGIRQSELTSPRQGLSRELACFLDSGNGLVPRSTGIHARLDRLVGGTPALYGMMEENGKKPVTLAKYAIRRYIC